MVVERHLLASAARQAFVSGRQDEALSSLSSLRDQVSSSADDVKWVEENIDEVKRIASSKTSSESASGMFPRIAGVKWRVDVAISTSHLDRVMRPSVVLELSLSDGRVRTLEMNMEQFHKLRYSVARMLRNMQEIERHPIMRLCDVVPTASSSKHA